MGRVTELEQSSKKAVEIANKALDLAEENGLTLAETMWMSEIMNNIIKNELRQRKEPYKRA